MLTREEWLNAAIDKFRPLYEGSKLPLPDVLVSCGFPASGGLSKNRKRGECWHSTCSANGSRQIFISPLESDPLEVLGVQSHELLHAALPDGAAHGPKFKDGMKSLGLEGKARSAMPGEHLRGICQNIAVVIGDYPHSALIPAPKKDRKTSKKSFKVFCPDKRDCNKACMLLDSAVGEDYALSVGKKTLKLGIPSCPCGHELHLEAEDYEIFKAIQD